MPITAVNLNFLIFSDNIRKGLKFIRSIFWVNGEHIGVLNKQMAQEPLHSSHDLFVLHADSLPMNPELRHASLKRTN